jgi:phosphoribosylaminoimidazole carboxylase (NCAIR synthetase)
MRDEIFVRDRIHTQQHSLVRVLLGGKALITVRELSILAARSHTGEIAFFPLVENHHREGILRLSLAPAPGATPRVQDALDFQGTVTPTGRLGFDYDDVQFA